MTHEVELPDDDSSVSTELQCDIQPGAMRQRYSVQWVQTFNSSDIIGDMFNLALIVNSTTNGSLYQCCVTINHNGSGLTSIYKGRLIEVITTEGIMTHIFLIYKNIIRESVDSLCRDRQDTPIFQNRMAQNSQTRQLQTLLDTYTYSTSDSVPAKTLKVRKIHSYNDLRNLPHNNMCNPLPTFYFVGLRMLLLLHAIIPCLHT